MKFSIEDFLLSKQKRKKISMITAYDYSIAKIINDTDIDAILVGDSLGMVCLGYENTLSVNMADMIHHTIPVVKGAKDKFVVVDMPFMSYHVNKETAVANAGELIKKTGATAVKLEGGKDFFDTIKAIKRAQIPVMGHLGLTPQSVNIFGGFKAQGKTQETAHALIEDAKALEEAGVFAIVLECIPAKLAKLITENLSIPTIGIGAGNVCDGQVLVYTDMFNLNTDFKPKFAKTFFDIGKELKQGINNYVQEVNNLTFPEEEHTYKIKDEILNKL